MSDTPNQLAAESPPASPETAEAAIGGDVSDEVLRLQLDQFEGPFEVLLYLIKSQEIDIFDIPIVRVTEQYLRFLELMREENLDVAGEFLVLAATLIQIKSRMILPLDTEDEEEEIEEEDPRLELVEKLLEYRKYRDLTEALGALEAARGNCFSRMVKPQVEVVDDEDSHGEATLYDLIKAIRGVLRYITAPPAHEIYGEGVSIEEKIALIHDLLEQRQSITWGDLLQESRSRIEAVCCLLAILELCRMFRVRVHQHHAFGEMRLLPRDPDGAPEEAEDVAPA